MGSVGLDIVVDITMSSPAGYIRARAKIHHAIWNNARQYTLDGWCTVEQSTMLCKSKNSRIYTSADGLAIEQAQLCLPIDLVWFGLFTTCAPCAMSSRQRIFSRNLYLEL